MTQYSDGTEIISERELRRRIAPGTMWPDIPTPEKTLYAEAGFFPVMYAELAEYQKHDPEKAFQDGDTVRIPAVDIPIDEAKAYALGEIDGLRTQKETAGISMDLNGNPRKFSTSINSQIKVGNVKSTGDTKTREWIMANGMVEMLTKAQIAEVFDAMQAHIENVFGIQAQYNREIAAAQTVTEVRNIIANARLAFG